MGVPLGDWLECLARHPRKYKFEGLDGYHTSVVDAFTRDDEQRQKMADAEFETEYEELCSQLTDAVLAMPFADAQAVLDEPANGYLDYLDRRYTIEPDDTLDDVDTLNARSNYINDRQEGLDPMDQDFDAAALLKEHPPVEVLSHASTGGIDVDDVMFFCPSCGQEPATWDNEAIDPVADELGVAPFQRVLRFQWVVCGTCNGRGYHTNPSIDAHGLTREDFDADPDFEAEYFGYRDADEEPWAPRRRFVKQGRGVYDVDCYGCHKRTTVPALLDDERYGPEGCEEREWAKLVRERIEDEYRYARQCIREREMGY